ncbi:MAG: VWA domain-containing protein [Planctomycetes bacterium]|nr:VWA domain-containing protein [Planctomycetota bacterium]
MFALAGAGAALAVALTFGELVWWAARPAADAPRDERPADAPQPAPPADVRLALAVSPGVSAYPGTATAFTVRVARDRIEGPVAVRFTSPSADISAADVVIPDGETRATAQVVVAPGAPPGTLTLAASATATADGKEFGASATLEVKVLAPPPPAPRLAVTVSPYLKAYQRGTNSFAVRVARAGFDAPVTVTFDDLPDGVSVAPVVVPAGATSATAELKIDGTAAVLVRKVAVSARADVQGVAVRAETDAGLHVLPITRAPVDLVFAYDCTGSMARHTRQLTDALPALAAELGKKTDARYGLIGFQDTTLAQPLKLPQLHGDGFATSAQLVGTTLRNIRLGGGGGEGDSSMDGIAAAADLPFRPAALRVIVLVTDGTPKKADGRIKSADDLAKHLKAKKIDQLHIVALADERKAFEPLFEGAKGAFFELKTAGGTFDALMTELGKTVAAGAPEPTIGKVDPGDKAREPVPPPPVAVKPPAPPAGAEPDEPKIEPPAPADEPKAARPTADAEPPSTAGAVAVWAVTVALFAGAALALGQFFALPGAPPAGGPVALGYGGGALVAAGAGALAYLALGALDVPIAARLAGALAFGAVLGAAVPLAERAFSSAEVEAEEVLELDDAPELVEAKPNIAAPKPRGGCPGCGRAIPGDPGERYCMLCDQTF